MVDIAALNQDAAVLLILLCMLATWAWVWKVIATRRAARGQSRAIAHLVGALAGSGAAFGAFCLSGALLMPGTGDGTSVAIGVFGMLVLCAYLAAPHPSRQEGPQSAQVEAAASKATAARAKTGAAPVPRLSFKATLQAERQAQERRQHALRQQQKLRRMAREKALGMSLGTFSLERMEAHAMFWCGVLFLSGGVFLFVFALPVEGWLIRLVMSFIVAGALAVVGMVSFLMVPLLLLLLCISIPLEAWWRIRHNRPYIAPRIGISHGTIAPPPPAPSAGNWLVPLAIGLWLGSAWSKDD